ncbi:MAG: 5-(carboxyamino)imidazole ribonucleotide synthase [Cytophagales bacterium]|nr:5-(carboxyamino)imidazole ribonucleotide synthase [Cytophagales bacterium]
MKKFYQDFKLGVLGGGQLGRMLIQANTNFNVYTSVIDPDPNAPCKTIASEFQVGSITDYDTVYNFGKTVDLLTIEIENVNIEALEQLEKEGLTVYPQPSVIKIIKDKRIQKQFYKDNNIPTADFVLTDNKEAIKENIDFLPAFNKVGTGGYDGGGVQRLESEDDLDKAFEAPSLLEKLINFDREISVVAARNAKGEVKVFPTVECVFDPRYNLVDYLIAPSSLAQEIQDEAEKIATDVINAFGIVGLLAVEMFVTKEGEVLVNEVAPRPHNSGHQTINANYTSQYEQHLRAILNLPLGGTDIAIPSAMVNLLGDDSHTGMAIYEGLDDVLAKEGVNLFLYGKKFTKPHRKMGHITIVNKDVNKLKETVEFVKKTIKVIS